MIAQATAVVNKKWRFSKTGAKDRGKSAVCIGYNWEGRAYTIDMKRRLDVKSNLFWWCAGGVMFVAVFGTILHFLYEWTGESAAAKPFSATDESTWQHMKIMYFPMVIYGVVQWFFFKREYLGFALVKLVGIVVGLSLIPILFYTYNGVIGKSPDWINIAIFFVSAAAAYIYEALQFIRGSSRCKNPLAAKIVICLIALLFVIFTYTTPRLGIFVDPLTGSDVI